MKNLSKLNAPVILAATFVLAMAEPALAAGGTQSVSNMFQTILNQLTTAGYVMAALAFAWSGIKFMFLGATIQHITGPLIGGVVLASCSWLANLLLG